MKVIYYYQTLVGLTDILANPTSVTNLIVSALHFGQNPGSLTPYIHLNKHPPDDPIHDQVWAETKQAQTLGIQIHLMLGGAGGAYQWLFSYFDTYYPLLKKTLQDRPWITGLDLDVEEIVQQPQIEKLIHQLRLDFGDLDHFTLTMAPIAYAMQHDDPGVGGFVYKKLYQTIAGQDINWFNVQAYGDYSPHDYELMVQNGYPSEKLVFGMISDQYDNDFNKALNVIRYCKREYGTKFGGVFDWEYFDAPPGPSPDSWAQLMSELK